MISEYGEELDCIQFRFFLVECETGAEGKLEKIIYL